MPFIILHPPRFCKPIGLPLFHKTDLLREKQAKNARKRSAPPDIPNPLYYFRLPDFPLYFSLL